MIVFALIILQLPWIIEGVHDLYYIIKLKESPNKKKGALIRVSVSVAVWFAWVAFTNIMDQIGTLASGLTVAFLCWSFHVVFFNYLMNAGMRRNLFILNKGQTDTFEAGLGSGWFRLFLRLVLLATAILIIQKSLIEHFNIVLI